jgi:hypothetical protein
LSSVSWSVISIAVTTTELPLIFVPVVALLQDTDVLSQLLDSGLMLVKSTRPQDCTTSAYLLLLLAKQPGLFPLLKEALLAQGDVMTESEKHGDIMAKEEALSDIMTTKSSNGDIMDMEQPDDEDNSNSVSIKATPIGSKSSGATLLTNVESANSWTNFDVSNVENSEAGRVLLLLRCVLEELRGEVRVARGNLLHAAATRPMYPALHVIRYLLENMDLKYGQLSPSAFCWLKG